MQGLVYPVIVTTITAAATWGYSIGTQVAVNTQKLQAQEVLNASMEANQEDISRQLAAYNTTLVKLVSKQDTRLSKLETIIEHVLVIEKESKK